MFTFVKSLPGVCGHRPIGMGLGNEESDDEGFVFRKAGRSAPQTAIGASTEGAAETYKGRADSLFASLSV